MTNDDIKGVAETIATYLGQMVNEDQISPPDVLLGGMRACIAFWGGCVPEGKRIEAMGILKQAMNEEIDKHGAWHDQRHGAALKIVYGNPKTILTMGMAMLGEVPTPFIGFVDKAKVEGNPFFMSGPDSTELINKIDTLGGVIVYIENPEAAQRLHEMMHLLFSTAVGGPWDDVEQVEAGLQ